MASRVRRAVGTAAMVVGLAAGGVFGAASAAPAATGTASTAQAETTASTVVDIPTLKLGSTGTGVKCAEQMLWVIGAPELAPDGIFGLHTQWRVKDFERFFGLTVDGEVDAQTGAAMFYIASLQGENPIRDPFDIWNAERAAYCEAYVPH
ncbi:MAG: peptidoglycan-binding domain-containing protein [Micromonosporaceae bacterium]